MSFTANTVATLHVHYANNDNLVCHHLRDSVMQSASGFWPISDENIVKIDTICIWAEPDNFDLFSPASFTAPVTGWSDVQWGRGRRRIIHFDREQGVFIENPGQRPTFNRNGCVITE